MSAKASIENQPTRVKTRPPFQVYEIIDRPGPSPLAESKGEEKKHVMLPRTGTKGKGGTAMSLPPNITYAPTIKHKWRFSPSSATASSCTASNLMFVAGGIASSATSVYSLSSSFRIHSIEIWPSASSTTFEDCNVQWQSPIAAVERDSRQGRDVPEGMSVTGKFRTTPPKGSLAGNWCTGGSVGIFLIAAPVGSIVDVVMEHTLSNALSNYVGVGSGMTIGDVYYGGLDSVGAPNYAPVGRSVT
jgi:hypothetical protein